MARARFEAGISHEGARSFAMNIALAQKVLENLWSLGVQDILLCAGARNSPFVMLLEKSKGFRVYNVFEERSAGFFALGRAQRDQRPVAVVTTSGTAVAELLPSAVEATYTQTPLIFVTADRPRSYRGTGAPQSIDQVGIFSFYVETCIDVASTDEKLDLSMWTRQAPLQLNVCFDEPLIDSEIPTLDFSREPEAFVPNAGLSPTQPRIADQPVVIAGPMSVQEAEQALPFLEKWGAPIYAEGLSNLRKYPSLQNLLIKSGDKFVRELFIKGKASSVIRVGGIPTLRFWRDLEEGFVKVPVLSISNSDFTGLSRGVKHTVGLSNLPLFKTEWTLDFRKEISSADHMKQGQLDVLLRRYPQSEVALIRDLSKLTHDHFVYLGNSLPIREWDLVSPYAESARRQAGNRGANGIDGQISSFLGGATVDCENWSVIGDLTALYDMPSLWIVPQLQKMKMRLVIVNNQGGLIFKNMFEKEIFLNRHQIEFSHWAKMWSWDYRKWTKIPLGESLADLCVIELVPDAEQSQQFWQEYKSL
jgi:2-succinyl-5-enolpyruvyl-6-hydroxy-3-cyclohexene-1-carboxylate synthase